MNIFRFIADMLHLAAILILLYRIKKSRNCIGKCSHILARYYNDSYEFSLFLNSTRVLGLSCKTQEVYLLVFCVRYLDLFMYFISLYNTFMKIFFISSTAFIIYLMRYKKPYCTVSLTQLVVHCYS